MKQQKEQTNGIYLLLGENEFEKEEFIKKITSEFSKTRVVETINIDGTEETSIDKFITYLVSPSLFIPYRIIILKNLNRNLLKAEKESLSKILKEHKDEKTLIIITSSLSPYKFDKSLSVLIEQVGGIVKVFWKVFDFALPEYVSNILSKNGIEASGDLVQMIIERNGQNINGIVEDIKYIRNYFQATEYISSDKAIQILYSKSGESNIFDLLSALIKGDKHKAILVLRNLFEKGEEIFALGSLLYSQLQKIIKVRKFLLSNISDEEICKQTNISSFELKNIKKISKDINDKKIMSLIRFTLEFEKFIRSYDDNIKLANIEKYIIEI